MKNVLFNDNDKGNTAESGVRLSVLGLDFFVTPNMLRNNRINTVRMKRPLRQQLRQQGPLLPSKL